MALDRLDVGTLPGSDFGEGEATARSFSYVERRGAFLMGRLILLLVVVFAVLLVARVLRGEWPRS